MRRYFVLFVLVALLKEIFSHYICIHNKIFFFFFCLFVVVVVVVVAISWAAPRGIWRFPG